MRFVDVANIFEKLEKTSKRLEKILILRNLVEKNPKNSGLLFDIISGDFTRKIIKKNLGISLKTVFSVIAFLSNTTQGKVEKEFNKVGDVGSLAQYFISKKKQGSLFSKKDLLVEDIVDAFNKISRTSGKDSQKVKKEILARLFISAKKNEEYKFLARFLVDDLRIGVSRGVLKEASVNYFFPNIINVHFVCEKCNYINLNMKKCFNCSKEIDMKKQENIVEKEFKLLEIGSPKEEKGLEEFVDVREHLDEIKYVFRNSDKKFFIKTQNPRLMYNTFMGVFERKYNLINSFNEIFDELNKDKFSILDAQIKVGNPIRSMLGTRAKDIEDAFKIVEKPALIDFKYDGLRVQIHNKKGEVKLFSRNLDEITRQFPEVVDYIKNNFSDLSFVIDCECVAYDFNKQKFLPFQILSKRILTKKIEDVNYIKVVVKVFDIMYLNKETLINQSYKERREKVEKIFLNRSLKQELCFDYKKLKSI